METAQVVSGGNLREEEDFRPRKRFKTSELPLNATQRSTIDGLLHTIKKKGEYDTLRKKVWSEFADSEAKKSFNEHLNELADAEIDRDPSLLSRDRGKAATLLQGAVDRSDIYKGVETSLDQLISEHLNYILAAGREIRKADIGEVAAAEEQRRGDITDEEYAKEAATKRDARQRQKKQDETRKRREEEKEQLRIATMKQEAELEKLRKMDERRREREAREEKLKEERRKKADEEEERRKRYEERTREEAAKRDPSHQTIEQAIFRHGSSAGLERTKKVSSRSPQRHVDKQNLTATATIPNIDEKAIEEAALEELLREGRELIAKSGTKPQVDRSESLDPPLLLRTMELAIILYQNNRRRLLLEAGLLHRFTKVVPTVKADLDHAVLDVDIKLPINLLSTSPQPSPSLLASVALEAAACVEETEKGKEVGSLATIATMMGIMTKEIHLSTTLELGIEIPNTKKETATEIDRTPVTRTRETKRTETKIVIEDMRLKSLDEIARGTGTEEERTKDTANDAIEKRLEEKKSATTSEAMVETCIVERKTATMNDVVTEM
ncbi:MAG: hypothetical protein Q9220_005314 [cf. Caloplaca sp. 1 TL-2023]